MAKNVDRGLSILGTATLILRIKQRNHRNPGYITVPENSFKRNSPWDQEWGVIHEISIYDTYNNDNYDLHLRRFL